MAEIRYRTKIGSSGTIYQIAVCDSTIVVRFSDPASRITVNTHVEKISS
jgi:hypothetical protein